MSEADEWKRRERGLFLGILMWAFGVAALVALRPETAADWILSTEWYALVGSILASIGLLGGFGHFLMVSTNRYVETDSELTEWDGEEV